MALLVHLMGSWLSARSPVSACSGLTGCCWKTVQSRSDLCGCRQHHPACWNGFHAYAWILEKVFTSSCH